MLQLISAMVDIVRKAQDWGVGGEGGNIWKNSVTIESEERMLGRRGGVFAFLTHKFKNKNTPKRMSSEDYG